MIYINVYYSEAYDFADYYSMLQSHSLLVTLVK